MDPDFTVVTPSLNYGRFIGDCLKSVTSQKGVLCEHLVFDGGSTDITASVVSQYPSVHFVMEPDHGMCDAINKGFRAAKGEWVMWLNADDCLLPDALRAVKAFAVQHPEADVIFGCWNFISSDGSFQRRMTLFPHCRAMMLYLGCYIGSTATFFRRKSVMDEGFYLNEKFRYVMDGEYYARLASFGKRFAYLPKVLANFRIHGGNLSKRNLIIRDANSWLRLQYQYAETRAFRRTYGTNWFFDENLNGLRDGLLYLYFRALKPVLKLLYLPRLEK